VLNRDHRLEVVEPDVGIAFAYIFLRHGEVHAIWLAPRMLIDPAELDLQLVRAERQCAQHAVAPCLADGGDDVATMAKGEQRELDS
jgi:hypothetical protein